MTATHSNNLKGAPQLSGSYTPYIRGPGITSSMEDHFLFTVTFYGFDCSVMTVHGSGFSFPGEASECLEEYWSIAE